MSAKKKAADAAIVPSNGAAVPGRARVQKAYKIYIGGAFVRSESGRYFQVKDLGGDEPGLVENVALSSRKDGRDAVKAAHAAGAGWAGKTAYNRGQILYRLGEVMEARRAELTSELERSTGRGRDAAREEVLASVDRVISFAGWADKYQSLLASSNPVAGPHFNVSVPEPMGVVAVVAPRRPSLLGLVSAVLPVIVSGNTCVVLASEEDPRTAVTFCECVATSDMPGGVLNLLTGKVSEVAPHLARHMEVQALDLWLDDAELTRELETLAVATVKRVKKRGVAEVDFRDDRLAGLSSLTPFLELKTFWHPMGM